MTNQHGYWLDFDLYRAKDYYDKYIPGAECSKCGKVAYMIDPYDYCPHCGVKMNEVIDKCEK